MHLFLVLSTFGRVTHAVITTVLSLFVRIIMSKYNCNAYTSIFARIIILF